MSDFVGEAVPWVGVRSGVIPPHSHRNTDPKIKEGGPWDAEGKENPPRGHGLEFLR